MRHLSRVGVFVLNPSCVTDQRPVFIVLGHRNTTSRAGRDVPAQTIILTPSRVVGPLTLNYARAPSRAVELEF